MTSVSLKSGLLPISSVVFVEFAGSVVSELLTKSELPLFGVISCKLDMDGTRSSVESKM